MTKTSQKKRLAPVAARLLPVSLAVLLSACYYAVPVESVPGAYTVTTPANFDRSFSAAGGAMRDQGLGISFEDSVQGRIIGALNGATVTANVVRQADGSVRVQFDGRDVKDPGLMDRISRSYDRRMGR